MKKVRRINAGIAIVVVAVAMSQCSKKNSGTASPAPVLVNIVSLQADGNLGNYLIDSGGHALYFFANDADGRNNCSGPCAMSWPAYEGRGLTAERLGAGLDLSDFGSTPSSTGGTQMTYKGWPLYSFSPSGTPEAAGHASGDGAGHIWFVAKPDYSIMLANWQLVGKDGKNYKSDYTPGDGETIYFTDALGHTLYAYAKDSVDHNKFTAPDFSNNALWPVYESGSSLSFPSALDKTDFASASVFGRNQLTYRGWPLYYFGADSSLRARNKGITVGSAPGTAGEVWSVMVQGIDGAPH
jgi:predicted lipoprotein with Yx(FWY)xxD motif